MRDKYGRSAQDVIANRLMMIRRGNPDMGGPNSVDERLAERLVEELDEFLIKEGFSETC